MSLENKILIIIPTYNEEENISCLIDSLMQLPLKLNVLVVDDGSDNTSDIVTQKMKNSDCIMLLKRNSKSGRGSAVAEGIKYGLNKGYEIFVEMDADFSHDPAELPNLITSLRENSVVIASRYLSGSKILNWPLSRKIFSKLANIFASMVLGIGIHDYTNGYRVYDKIVARKIDFSKIKSSGYIVLSEIAYQLFKKDTNFIEIETRFVNRNRGISNFSIKEISEAFISVFRIKTTYK